MRRMFTAWRHKFAEATIFEARADALPEFVAAAREHYEIIKLQEVGKGLVEIEDIIPLIAEIKDSLYCDCIKANHANGLMHDEKCDACIVMEAFEEKYKDILK